MKSTLLLAALPLALATTALAAPDAPPPNYPLPQAYNAYSQPDVTDCASTGPLERHCTVPAMTAGRYLILAASSATATQADATQTLAIKLGETPCAATKPAPFTDKKGLRLGCVVSLLTDKPIVVSAVFETHDATPSADGPKLVFQRLPWTGVVESAAVAFRAPAAAAAAAPKE
ncbi:MAG TPA: hypothetical protein VN814_07295 [Caulobacteraceae bacterium]|nr:hypothetical protein [Caulobacteraceae bacterium]